MNILFRWDHSASCNDLTGYIIEVAKSELNNEVIALLSERDKVQINDDSYISYANSWNKTNPNMSTRDCFYLLVAEDLSHLELVGPEFPYSGLWNANNPLIRIEGKINNFSELKDYQIKEAIKTYLKARTGIIELGRKYPELIGGNDNFIGRIGEYIALRFLESLGQKPIKVLESSNKGFDFVENEIMTQVKCLTKENKKGKSVRLSQPWTQFLLLELDDDYIPERIGLITEKQFIKALSENANMSKTPVVKIGMLSTKGLIGKYGKIYTKEIIHI